MDQVKESLKARRTQLTGLLKTLGATTVEVEYDGCGDSGDVQAVRVLKGGRAKPDAVIQLGGQSLTVESLESDYDVKAQEYRLCPHQTVVTLEKALGDFAMDFLSFLGIDWYNNEGGYGTIVLDIATGEVTAEHYYRVESSEYAEHAL